MVCTTQSVLAALRSAAAEIAAHRDELVLLDRAIGNGDHGENLRRGFDAFVSKLDTSRPATPAAAMKLLGTTLIATAGGTSGPLYGTAFLRASSAIGSTAELSAPDVVAALRAALDGVRVRGKAALGEKTMVDALAPAVAAAESAVDGGIAHLLAAAAEAAEAGAEATVPLVARQGRAAYLGVRSAGHLDPGARSTALLLRAFAGTAV